MGVLNTAWFRAWGMVASFRPFAQRETLPERQPGGTQYVTIPKQIGGVRVNEETALQVSTVFACISVITKALASSSWDVFSQAPDGNREMRRQSPLWRLLNVRPNPEMTAFDMREAVTMSALLWGNGYAEIERDAAGRALALWPLHPDRPIMDRTRDGALVYRVHNPSGPESIIPARDMFHLHGPGIDGLVGYEMTRLAARAIGHSMAAETFGAAFFGNGTQMGGVLASDQLLPVEKKDEIRDAVNQRHQGPENAHQFLIVDGGMKYQPLTTTPEDGQFIETRHLSVEEICRWYGVPPHKIAHLLRSTNNNIEHQGLEFVRDALTPWAERMAQEADFKLLPLANRAVKTRFDLDWHSDGDAKSRAEADSTLVNSGILSVNDVLRRRGQNTIGPDGDKRLVQLNMTTLERIGEEPAAAPAPAPAAEPPAPPGEGESGANPAARAAVVPLNRRTGA